MEDEEADLLAVKAQTHHKHDMPQLQFVVLTLGILISGFLIAYNVHELDTGGSLAFYQVMRIKG